MTTRRSCHDDAIVERLSDPSVAVIAGGGRVWSWKGAARLFEDAPVVGRGAFATVFDLGVGVCAKAERLSDMVSTSTHVLAVSIAIWAGSVGVAPRVHAWTIVRGAVDGVVAGSASVIVMDLVDGTTLDRWLTASGRSRNDIERMEASLRVKVGRLYDMGVAHNDLHLANIIVDKGMRPWLIDFTFARMGATGKASIDEPSLVIAEMWRVFEMTYRGGLGI